MADEYRDEMTGDIVVVEDDGLPIRRDRLKKHVALIHAFSGFTLLQRRICNVLLWNAYHTKDSSEAYWFSISLAALRSGVGYGGHNFDWVRDGVRGLKGVSVEYDVLGEGVEFGEGEGADGDDEIIYLSSVPFINVYVYRSGTVRYQLNPEIADELLDPQTYAYLDMEVQKRFRSKWGHALYETVARFARIGSTGMRPVETWRRLFGVRPGTYSDFTKFRRNVLEPAMRDVQQNTDFRLRAELKKDGARYSHLRILISQPEQRAEPLSPPQARLHAAMVAKGVVSRVATDIVHQHRERDIREALDELSHRERSLSLENPGGWFVKRLQAIAERSRFRTGEAEGRSSETSTNSEQVPVEHVERLPSIDQLSLTFDVNPNAVWEDFLQWLGPAERRIYKRSGVEHPAIRSAYQRFLSDRDA